MDQPEQSADPRLVALVAAYQAQTVDLRVRIDRYVRALWRSFRLHDNAAQAEFAATVAPVVTGAQMQMGSLTAAFLGSQRQIALEVDFQPFPIDPATISGPAVRNDVPDATVYGRPFNTFWYELSRITREAGEIERALLAGEQRAASIAATNIQLAKTHTQRAASLDDERFAYSRRILEGPTSCGLCIVASTQRYGAGELMPIHPGCDCGQEVIYVDEKPSRIIDLDTLQNLQERVEQRFGSSNPSADDIADTATGDGVPIKYRDLIVVHEHGEIGPILGVRGQAFTTLDDLVAAN